MSRSWRDSQSGFPLLTPNVPFQGFARRCGIQVFRLYSSCGGGATQRYSVSTRQADGALVAVEEDTTAMAKLLLMSLVAKSCKAVIGLLVGACGCLCLCWVRKKSRRKNSPWTKNVEIVRNESISPRLVWFSGQLLS